MTDEISARNAGTKKSRSHRQLAAMIAACGLILAGGITVLSVSAARASAEETTRMCTVALYQGSTATKLAASSSTAADKALETVKSTKLPKDAGTSTVYAKHPEVKAVTVSKSGKTVPARASGADFIGDVIQSQDVLVGIQVPAQCADRVQAGLISTATAKSSTATKGLDTDVQVLLTDFTVFQTGESKRIAAEKKAAAEKAAAAKKKAEAEAAAESAAEAAQAQPAPQYVAPETAGGGGGYVPAPAPYVPAPAPVPAPYVPAPAGGGGGYKGSSGTPGGGGGGVVPIDPSNKACWTSNGKGGTMPCP